ncbi:MAG TPA: response regulator [Caulobacteraceae bacterium]|nr:response regulator [Caulobacteraceae bacterium]
MTFPSPLGKLAFLVIDDNANMVQIVKTILKNFGVVHVYEARDVAEAFGIVRQYAIDIVLVDYNLGFMDGVEFVKLMRTATDSPNPYLPVIMLTAHTEQRHVERARDAGVTEFCAKPVAPADIYRKIIQVIERPRPFVRTATYFGPDRHRHDDGADFKGPERRRDRMTQATPLETEALEAKAG